MHTYLHWQWAGLLQLQCQVDGSVDGCSKPMDGQLLVSMAWVCRRKRGRGREGEGERGKERERERTPKG